PLAPPCGQPAPPPASPRVAACEVEAWEGCEHLRPLRPYLIGRLRGGHRGTELLADPLLDELDREPVHEQRVLVEARNHTPHGTQHGLLPYRAGVLQS